jgi:hypothetical protein
MKKILEIDQKVLTPNDHLGVSSSDERKSVKGVVLVSNSNNTIKGENLVVLSGRELLAEKLTGLDNTATPNYLNYKISYFSVGKGGAEDDPNTGDPTVKKGPYANDTDLYDPVKLGSGNSTNGVTYIDNGYLKYIAADSGSGSGITIESETHNIITESGAINIDAYTVIHHVMFVNSDEAQPRPYGFNEAALWAVEYDPSTNKPIINYDGTTNKVMIAHFTTSTKFIEANEGLQIDWYVLV